MLRRLCANDGQPSGSAPGKVSRAVLDDPDFTITSISPDGRLTLINDTTGRELHGVFKWHLEFGLRVAIDEDLGAASEPAARQR